MIKSAINYQTDRQTTNPYSMAERNRMPPSPPSDPYHGLSQREIEIMQWLKIGKSNQEIASILEICTCTVKNHLQRIFRKLEVYNRTHAVAKFFISAQDLRN